MARYEDEIVTADEARRLKSIGFPQDGKTYRCGYYNPNDEYVGGAMCIWSRCPNFEQYCCAPNPHQVQRWFRTEKSISIEPFYKNGGFQCVVCMMDCEEYIRCEECEAGKLSYEDAMSYGIKHAISLFESEESQTTELKKSLRILAT